MYRHGINDTVLEVSDHLQIFFWKAYNILINIWNSKCMICCAEASEKKDKKYPPRYEGVNIKCFFQAYFQNPMPNYQ